ncbi:hypothetical protein Esti_002431 [Eimeria stiedai]
MAKLKRTWHFSCLARLLVLLMQLQQNQCDVAFAGNGDDAFSAKEPLPCKDTEPQESQLNANEPAVLEDQPLALQASPGQDVRQGALTEDGGGYSLISEAQLKFSASISNLRRLEALMPTAHRLFIAVDTRESQLLWTAVEKLLPDLTRTLSTAEAKSQEPSFFLVGLLTGEYRNLLQRVNENAKKASEAIAALHRNAREQLEVMAKSITKITSPRFWSLKDQLGKVLGFRTAEAYVAFVNLQEARGESILRMMREVIERSNKTPVFEGDMDEALLRITMQHVEHLKQMVIARDDVLTRIVRATTSCAEAVASTMRAEIMATEQRHRTLLLGISYFFEQSELQIDVLERLLANSQAATAILNEEFSSILGRISEDLPIEELLGLHKEFREVLALLTTLSALPEKQVLPEGQADERSLLRKNLSGVMKAAVNHAAILKLHVHTVAEQIKQSVNEARKVTIFPTAMEDICRLAEKYSGDAEGAAASCRQIADQLDSDDQLGSLFEAWMKGVEESTEVSRRYTLLQSLRGVYDLLKIYEADVSTSLAIINAVDVSGVDLEDSSGRKIFSLKEEAATVQALVADSADVYKLSSGAINIRRAADSVGLEQYRLIVSKLEKEHKRANLRAWESANQ